MTLKPVNETINLSETHLLETDQTCKECFSHKHLLTSLECFAGKKVK